MPILASAQTKPDTLYFVNGEKVMATISKISSEEVEYTYPNEVLVNIAKTKELLDELNYQNINTFNAPSPFGDDFMF